MTRRLRIALLIGASRQYHRDLLDGIAAYARVHGPWIFYHEEQIKHVRPAWLKGWRGDGILSRIESRKLLEQIGQMGVPTVDLLGLHDAESIPSFDNDTVSMAQMAANHFLERGFEHFAYCGFAGVHYSDNACDSLVGYLDEMGHVVDVYNPLRPSRQEEKPPAQVAASTVEAKGILQEEALGEWLDALPKPLGLIACNDLRAHQVLNACTQRGIAVPDEVAVLGADNDEVLCELSNPPLSSVDPNAQKMGYEAAALLERMINGEPPPDEKILIEPTGVITRKSTDVTAIPDRAVAAALFFIRENACQGINVDMVLRKVRLSRSTLERRFAKYVGCSPKNEILRVQLRHVKQFLTETDYHLAKVARLSGFNHVENMCHFFKSKTGETPGRYRKRQRPRSE